MPVEHADDHPTFERGGNAITSLAAPSRGSDETALFRVDLPPAGTIPFHRHDHFDVFTVTAGDATFHLDGDRHAMTAGDSAVVPIGSVHGLEAGEGGATIIVTMVAGTKLIAEDDGVEVVPDWVG
jgi:quercetin dioxygenase-like cupin family protein